MRTNTCLLTAVVVSLALMLPATGHAIGEEATDFNLKSLDGKTVYLSDYLGEKVIVMSFFVIWCKPCEQEYPQLQRLYDEYKDDGLVVLGISADGPSSLAQVGPTMRRYKVEYPVLLDTDNQVLAQYNPNNRFPYTIIIAKDKTIKYVHEGFSAGDEKEMEEKIKEYLGVQ